MTSKEKANDAFDKFRKEFGWVESDYAIDLYRDARQCALICVDEFIDALSFNSSPTAEGLTEFYEEVKQEINKL